MFASMNSLQLSGLVLQHIENVLKIQSNMQQVVESRADRKQRRGMFLFVFNRLDNLQKSLYEY